MAKPPIQITPYELALRYVGLNEIPGAMDSPLILAMLKLDTSWPAHDEIAWCSSYVNWIAWHLKLPRSKSLAARSWLGVGEWVALKDAEVGFDIVVLQRGSGPQPGREVFAAAGHVGFFAGRSDDGGVLVLGGNQSDAVNVQKFDAARVLDVRRL